MYQTQVGISLLWEMNEYPRMHLLHGDVQEKELLLSMANEFMNKPECVSVQVILCTHIGGSSHRKFARAYLFNWKRKLEGQ